MCSDYYFQIIVHLYLCNNLITSLTSFYGFYFEQNLC